MAYLIDPLLSRPFTVIYLIQAGVGLILLALYAWCLRGQWRPASPWNRVHILILICVSMTILNTLQQVAHGAMKPPQCHAMVLLGGAGFWAIQGIMMTVFSLRLGQMNVLGSPADHCFDRVLRLVSGTLTVTLPSWHEAVVIPYVYSDTGNCTFRFNDGFTFVIVAHIIPTLLDMIIVSRYHRYLDISLCCGMKTESGRAKARFFTIIFVMFVLQSLQALLTLAILVDLIPVPIDIKPPVCMLRHFLCNIRLTLPLLVVQCGHRRKHRTVISLACTSAL